MATFPLFFVFCNILESVVESYEIHYFRIETYCHSRIGEECILILLQVFVFGTIWILGFHVMDYRSLSFNVPGDL